MATYLNPWHNPADKHSEPACYTTEVEPAEYRGYLIYQRASGKPGAGVWDVVKDGACVTQMAGPTGARKAIDKLLA